MSHAPAEQDPAGAALRPPGPIRLIGWISTAFGICAAFMILAAVLITCHMIFVRAVMGLSTIWQTEAVIYLMIGATMLGLAYVQRLRGHVGVDLLPTLLPPLGRRLLAAVVMLATIAMAAAMLWYGWDMFHESWRRNWTSESVWAFPLWITYLSVPLGFALYLLQLLADLWLAVFGAPATLPEPHPERSPD